ncbi:hypothetical protein C1645_837429 [Glomus cerebriforme]|uniref:Endonuclease/exonuclease/phosphatase n=1 Tax=Glomus cerebriforme TaxID=658196 RepID=A0A397S6P9_9GLOM|nr:hypothetical protein C1645_837429 [Glomus cerebriforme]
MQVVSERALKRRRQFTAKILNIPPNTTEQQLEKELLPRHAKHWKIYNIDNTTMEAIVLFASLNDRNLVTKRKIKVKDSDCNWWYQECYFRVGNERRTDNIKGRATVFSDWSTINRVRYNNRTRFEKPAEEAEPDGDIEENDKEQLNKKEQIELETITNKLKKMRITDHSNDKLTIITHNVRGINDPKKSNQIIEYIRRKKGKWDIIGLLETKLKARNDRYKFRHIENQYAIIASHEENSKEGVALLIRKQLNKNIRNIEKIPGQLIKVELIFNNEKNRNMIIIQVYKLNNDQNSRTKIKKMINE